MESITQELKVKTPKAKPVRTVAAIMDEIKTVSIDYRRARQVALGAEIEANAAEQFCANSLIFSQSATDNPDDAGAARGAYLTLGDELTRAAGLRFLADSLARNETVIEARSILDPLFSEVATAQENERIEAAKAAAAAQDLRDAKAAALADLQAQVDSHPLVVEAAKKAAPFFRKGELVTG
jgi:hypothetical protein